MILWSSTSSIFFVCTSSAQSTREPSNSTCISLRRMISPSNADANATGISISVILILIPLASSETLLKSATSGHAINAPGTSTIFSSSLEITGKPSLIAPAPAARMTSSIGLKAFTKAGTLFFVYVSNAPASPGVTLPKISAARIATDTT